MKKIFPILQIAIVVAFVSGINFLTDLFNTSEGLLLGGVTLTSGFRDSVLYHLRDIAKENTPQLKLDPHGYLAMLYKFRKPEILGLNNSAGHKKTVRVKYLQRFTKDFTDTSKSCDQTNVQPYLENNVELSSTRQLAIHINDETIAKYNDDASRTVRAGQPATDLMNELMEQIMSGANAILDGVSSDLQTSQSAQFGVNRRTGSANAATININANNDTNVLTDGITQMLSDFQQNRGKGRPQIVGNGLMHNWMIQNGAIAGANASGLDTRLQGAGFDFYYDLETINTWGANQVAVFEPNSVGIVEYLEYTGFKAGEKPGASTFGTIMLPMVGVDGNNVPVSFDYQLKYYDCATTLTDAYYGTSLSVEKGYNLILSKQSGLYTIPDDAYRGTDVLSGNRGTYRYAITNSCETC